MRTIALLLALAAPTWASDDYTVLLGKVVRQDSVDYTTLLREREVLDAYVRSLETAPPGKTDAEKMAFWINAYNALTLQQVIDTRTAKGNYSVRDVEGFWTQRTWTVAERKVTLDRIENRILLAAFKEPRVHFAVNCASRSCPPLLNRPYDADTLDVVLAQRARAYLANERHNTFDEARRIAKVSMIFQWYESDFRPGGKALQQYLARNAPGESLRQSLREREWRIQYLPYDWSLNEAGVLPDAPRDFMGPLWLALYLFATLGLLMYGLHAFKLLSWRRNKGGEYRDKLRDVRALSPLGRIEFPKVLVQVPVFNESGVVERVIDAVSALDYPVLEIQILDDSTDKTVALIDRAVARQRDSGVPISVVRRTHRDGFKAGALAAGLARSDAEFVAIFDADFVPQRDFVRRALPLFQMPGRVACVQGRWEHLNREQNWLTRAQAVSVDAHFHVQQMSRAAAGAFLNFDGTAGMWRCAAIDAAGGWRGDTLTEDLDLSYRAQLAGWRIVFDPDLSVPAELPPTVAAYKSQQRRWACGSIQCARRFLGPVWRSDLAFRVKAEATVHLCGYGVCVAMMALVLLLPYGVSHWTMLSRFPELWPLWFVLWFTALGPICVVVAGQRSRGRVRAREVFSCFLLGLGSCANNAVAVLRGLWLPIRTFVRTPKQGRLPGLRGGAPVLEQAMMAFTLGSVAWLARTQPFAWATYGLFCSAGFCSLVAYWWLHERRMAGGGESS